MALSPGEARELVERSGAILSGHFELTSGRHSDLYVQKARILEHPDITLTLAREIASWYDGIEVVVAPAVGAIPLGFAVALSAGARSIFAERDMGAFRLRRGFALRPGEAALVVEDVITTGGSAAEIYRLVQESGARAQGVAALVDRSEGLRSLPSRSILRLKAVSWAPEECPLCQAERPVDAPGSRRLFGN